MLLSLVPREVAATRDKSLALGKKRAKEPLRNPVGHSFIGNHKGLFVAQRHGRYMPQQAPGRPAACADET